jgi:hypothetical protein
MPTKTKTRDSRRIQGAQKRNGGANTPSQAARGAADGKSNSLVVVDSNAGIMAVKIAKNKR